MLIRHVVFGLGTAILVAMLGALLSAVDPAGWNLMAVGVALGILTTVSTLLQPRHEAIPATIPAQTTPVE